MNQSEEGQPLDAGYRFELGFFAGGFEPSAENTRDWASHWMAIQGTAYNVEGHFFAGSAGADLLEGIPAGSRGYIWGFNSRDLGDGAQWVLVSNPAWVVPTNATPTNSPLEWFVSDAASEALVGAVNGGQAGYQLRTAAVGKSGAGESGGAAAWREARFAGEMLADPAVSGWGADPDGDGLSNLLEFAFGGDPMAAGSRLAPVTELAEIGGERFLVVAFGKPAGDAVVYTVEVCSDAQSWQSGDEVTEVLNETDTEAVVRDRVPLGPGAGCRFIRVRVEMP